MKLGLAILSGILAQAWVFCTKNGIKDRAPIQIESTQAVENKRYLREHPEADST
jgi:hypothetical protein